MPQSNDTDNEDSIEIDTTQETGGDKETQKIIITALVAFILGISAGFILSNDSTTQTPSDNTPATTTNATTTQDTESEDLTTTATTSLAVDNQPAGNTVTITSAQIDRTGWVAIYETIDGEPGSILGARLISEAGGWSGDVSLLRNTEPNESYFVKLLNDNGDEEFNHEEDLPIETEEGADVQTQFETMPASPRG